jgi:RNA polymerase sigma-70 factor (ECF subfamily)
LPTQLAPKQEKVLVENAQQDLAAFQDLFKYYFPKVYAYVNYRVARVQDAEDIVANTFLKATERLSEFDWRGDGSFAAWLFRIAHDLVIDFYRQDRKTATSVSLDELPNIKSNTLLPDDTVMQKEKFKSLRKLISTLSPRRQEIITLKFFGGLRNKEIADLLRLDERTVASHLCRGLEDLHQRYVKQFLHLEKEDAYD